MMKYPECRQVGDPINLIHRIFTTVDTAFGAICVALKSRIDLIIVYQTLFAADFVLATAESDGGDNGLMV